MCVCVSISPMHKYCLFVTRVIRAVKIKENEYQPYIVLQFDTGQFLS